MNKKLIEYILEAKKEGQALGHFNFGSFDMLQGILDAQKALNCPIIVGLSEGERDFLGGRRMVNLIKKIRDEEGIPVFINADHTHKIEDVKKAIDDGFDSIVVDGSKLSFEENVNLVKQAKKYAKEVNSEILIEGELGFIGESSKIIEALPEGVADKEEFMTQNDEALRFVKETEVDLFSPSVGTVHGMVRGDKDPVVSGKRIAELNSVLSCPMVLHGGSGTKDENLKEAVKAGIALVHISTELRIEFRKGLEEGLSNDTEELAPYRYISKSVQKVSNITKEKLQIFGWGL
jgi:fructose-bisphosphate aldolase class II